MRGVLGWGGGWNAPPDNVALLLGAWHAPTLCRCAEVDGWNFDNREWRTAMVLRPPNPSVARVLSVVVVAATYVSFAAFDWVSFIDRITLAFESSSARSPAAVLMML